MSVTPRRPTEHDESTTAEYACLFHDLKLPGVPKSDFRHKLDQLNTQCENEEFDSDAEWIQAYNLMTYCYMRVRDTNKAHEYNDKALQMNGEDVIALGNKVWMHEQQLAYSNAEATMSIITNLKQSEVPGQVSPFIISEAGIAYSYTRFGPQFAQQAIDIYTRVIDHVTLIGNCDDVSRWKYEMALAARRLATYYLYGSNLDASIIVNLLKQATHLVDNVIRTTQYIRLKARAWALLGEITITTRKQFSENMLRKQHGFPSTYSNVTSEKMLDNALKIDDHDGRVLETCAKCFRHLYKYDKAIMCLHKANGIRETSFAHHHMALAFQSKKKETERHNRYWLKKNSDSTFPTRQQPTFSHSGQYNTSNSAHRQPFHKGYVGSQGELSSTTNINRRGKGTAHQKYRNQPCAEMQPTIPSENSAVVKMRGYLIRCPRFPNIGFHVAFDRDAQVILHHFQRAVDLRPGNGPAKMNMGDFYGMLGNYETAKTLYKEVINSNRDYSASMLVTCYEQCGFCYLKLSEVSSSAEEEKAHYSDAIQCFIKAVEICASEANKSLMGIAWQSLPTLKKLLSNDGTDPNKKKKLGELYDMLGNYKDAIAVYLEIQDKDITVYPNLINTYIHNSEFDKALYFINVMKCSQETMSIPPEMYIKCCIEGAMQAHSRNAKHDAMLRFKDAFIHSRSSIFIPEETNGETSDVFIIVSDESECKNSIEDLKTLLSAECGFKITSTDDIASGVNVFTEFERLVRNTYQLLIVVDSSENNDIHFNEMVRRSCPHPDQLPILVVTLGTLNIPSLLRPYPAIGFTEFQNCEFIDIETEQAAGDYQRSDTVTYSRARQQASSSNVPDGDNAYLPAVETLHSAGDPATDKGIDPPADIEEQHSRQPLSEREYSFIRKLFYIICGLNSN